MARRNGSMRWKWCTGSVLLAVLFAVACVRSEDEAPEISQTAAMNYLSQFGYLQPINPTSGGIISKDALSKAIAEFQSFAGLNITGDFDAETYNLMALPRCGVKDKVGPGFGRSKRYALQGSRWRVKKLTYKISKYPRNLPQQKVDAELNKAFKVWSEYTDLVFTQKKSGQVHIEIRFEKGEHGDGDPFDGPGGTLAHAYFPVYGGDAHFDDAEQWTIDSFRGTNLFQVAAHEFGHSLGLSHSDVKSALMAPFYRGYEPYFRLDEDDVQGIQSLYGKKSSNTGSIPTGPKYGTTTVAPPSEEDSELCTDPKVDTMFNSAEGHIYVFKGDRYWRLTADGVAVGYPKLISHSWKGLPGNIDAAFTYKNGKTYFFKGSKYWRYVGKRMDGDYPKEISEGFTGIPDNIDTVIVDVADPAFPRSTAYWWFGCRSANKGTLGNVQWLRENPEDSFPHAGILDSTGGDFNGHDGDDDDNDEYGDVGDIILDAGETDEQLVTSSNQDTDSGAGSVFKSSSKWWYLSLNVMTMIVAKIIAAT
ncbi:Matrix metalloproteinase-14 [Dufourea novaeangliae]|uniref:Matrix metalloproteinase-14 n=1 Tax=Dufourea novaeangliae TaxID=178035 RepID=A0A154PE33_DUFNO|nr:Matrix metalloproteinase-14 [Dufourea novaeangliae]